MNKCELNNSSLLQIKDLTAQLLKRGVKERWDVNSLKSNFNEFIKQVLDTYKMSNNDDIKLVADIMYTQIPRAKRIVALDPEYLSMNNVINLLDEAVQGVEKIDTKSASIEKIEEGPQNRLQASDIFLDKAYGGAVNVRNIFCKQIDQNLFDCMFINRGSINTKLGIVGKTCDLNNNIREYQDFLLQKIVEYLNTDVLDMRVQGEVKNILTNPRMYNRGKYTKALDILSPYINTYLKSLEGQTDQLRQLFKNRLKDPKSKRRLDAFNAMVILNNFDSYVSNMLGKAIQIKDFGLFTGEDKYQISDQTANVYTTWRTSENINIANEADAITKLAVNTTPLLNWNNDTPSDGKYLKFQDFQHIISKIKDLTYNPAASSIIFDDNFELSRSDIWDSLSKETQEYLKGKSLRAAISLVRSNPRAYLHSVFEILSNNKFKKLNPQLYSKFYNDELNKLYSISQGLFNGNYSLRTLTDVKSPNDFYSYLTQTADSIFNVQYLQYYRDDNGLIKSRTLLDQGVNNVRRSIEQAINLTNSYRLIGDWKKYSEPFNFQEKYNKDNSALTELSFNIPNTDFRATVDSTGKVRITKNGFGINYSESYEELKPFIDNILKLNLEEDTVFEEAIFEELGDSTVQDLSAFATRVIFNQYVNQKFLLDVSPQNRDIILSSIYGKTIPNWNYAIDELGLIHKSDLSILHKISVAKSNVQGLMTSTQVKDSQGKAQSRQTLSRLLGSFNSQYELQERLPDSISNHFMILNTPGLFEGVYTVKEFAGENVDSKETTSMTVREMALSQFMYDYIGGIMPQDENNLVGNGHIMLLPSVNSDKSTIGRIKINLNSKININGEQKALKDLTTIELEQVIDKEFGDFYEKMVFKIQKDWRTLQDFIGPNLGMPRLDLDFLNNFSEFNTWYANNRKESDPKRVDDFIKKKVLEYNKVHRLSPLELIDQVHFKSNKNGNLSINEAILAQIARFKPSSSIFNNNQLLLYRYRKKEDFWIEKKSEVLKSLLSSKTNFNTSNTVQAECNYLRDWNRKQVSSGNPNWINSSGNLILAKIIINQDTPDERIVDITSQKDFVKLGISNYHEFITSHAADIQLNPLIEKYNALDYLFTQEFMNTTVGSFVAHPNKTGSQDVIEQEAGHFQAQHKRNVSMTAAMHEFQLNLLSGIPETYNLAVIDDIHDEQGTITGLINGIKPFDGATFVNPFVVLLENYSLCGAKAGISKKQFVHFKNEKTGTGGIIKTAGFGLTNDWIRNSPFLQKMMRKMTNHVWLNEDGSSAHVDITKDYSGNKIEYKNIYYKQNGKYYRITDITYNGNNTYTYNLQEVDAKGNFIQYMKPSQGRRFVSEQIDTNYKLWNFFGGAWSMELKNGKLVPSNTSVENVVTAMNNTKSEETVLNKTPKTQSDLWQPLKMVDVHYLATAGAVKQGAANINSSSKYTDEEDYDIQKIHMYQAGIQLDKEHHADEAELSLMTQVISACAAKGYTFEAAATLYDALAKATRSKTSDHLKAVENLFNADTPENKAALREVLVKSIVKVLSTSNSNNFAVKLSKELEQQAKNGKEIKYSEQLLPLSDNNIHAKVLSAITSYLSKTGIKQKIPGVLSVLTPSYNINKIYAGKKYEAYENPDEELEQIQTKQVPVYDSSFKYRKGSNSFRGLTLNFVEPNSLISEIDGQPVAARNNGDGIVSLDEALLKQKFEDRAWKYSRNSRALDQDFETYEDWLNFVLLHESMHDEYKKEEGESQFDYESRVNDEALKRLNSSINNIELGREYYITENVQIDREMMDEAGNIITVSEIQAITGKPRLIRTPLEYYQLKQDIATGKVSKVVECVKNGRDLAGFNVRFKTDKGYFQLWDLDSSHCLFNLNEISEGLKKGKLTQEEAIEELRKTFQRFYPRFNELGINITFDNFPNLFKQLKRYSHKKLQQDLANLSKEEPNVLEQFQKLVKSKQDTPEWYSRFASWINVKLGLRNGEYIQLGNGTKVKVTRDNYNQVGAYVLQLFKDMSKVRINGELHKIDKESIKTQPYEVIMPKTFATAFGLNEFDSLEEIAKDPEFFLKQYIKNQASKVAQNQYSVEFKRSTGQHIYVLNKSQVPGSGLHKLEGVLTEVEDGVTTRLDSMNQPMYELSPDSEIYIDDQGNEVIVSDDIEFYTNSLFYDSIKISENLRNNSQVLRSLPEIFRNSSNKTANAFGKFLRSYGDSNIIMGSDDWNDIDQNHPIVKLMHEKHSSFLRALDIVAARIPAQSMQSYMPMKVVAFDNPNINTAYVSTYQILLQGSDYDIDAVSLATFDIDSNGMYQLWSPYANISDIEKLHASELLPIPTGLETEIKSTNDIAEAIKIFDEYQDLISITPRQTYNKESKLPEIDPNKVNVDLNLDTAEQIKMLGDLLNEQLLSIDPVYAPQFIKKFNKLGGFQVSNIEQINDILSQLKSIIDKHNFYFDKVSEKKLNHIINNRTILSMYNSINNPVNLTQAHMSVDNTTGPLKDVAENGSPEIIYESKHRTPGNFVNKCESINENQVGKTGIAICATGLKGFFALTQYNNYLLNKGTSEEQNKLLFNVSIGNNIYRTLANIRALDPNTITNNTVLKCLAQTDNDEDAALVLSALLSLATDNAKELALSKLNAGTKTLGMYVYGIAIGMDFKDIARLLMSKTGKTIVDISESDVFDQTDGYITIKSAFGYFEQLPNKYLNKYNIRKNPNGTSIKSPLEFFEDQIRKLPDDFYFEDDGREMPLNVVLSNFAKRNWDLSDKLQILESLRNRYNTSAYGSEVYEQLIDFLEDYVIGSFEVNEDYETYQQLKTLAEGADEMKTLGQILGLNGGIATDYEGLTKQIDRIEEVIYKQSHDLEDIIDLSKFVFDSEYRQECIEKYETFKHTFNILDCLAKVPHFFEYVKQLAVAQEEIKQSYKYRSVKSLARNVSDVIGWSNKGKISKGLQNYIGDKIRNDWMLDSEIIMDMPSGIKAFDRNGDSDTLTESKPIRLGTDWGNATFRIFMETQVIPDLKKGIIRPGTSVGSIKTNKFIKDLTPDLFTKTVSSNPTILYTLPINMLPRTDVEQSLLDSYIGEFNELAGYTYDYNVIKRDVDGNEQIIQQSIPIKDLFIYYSMIAHNWKLGENSLVPILENFQDTGLIDAFHKYEASLDNSGETLTEYNINEILPYVVPRMSPYSAYTKYIKAKNPSSKKIEIMKRTVSDTQTDNNEMYEGNEMYEDIIYGMIDSNKIGNYEFIQNNLDTNYFTSGIIGSTDKIIKSEIIDNKGESLQLEIQYDSENDSIKRVAVDNVMYDIKTLSHALFTKIDGRKVPNLSLMKSIIKNELYPCHV